MKSFLRYALAALGLCFLSAGSANATTCSGGTPANTCYWIGGTGTWDNSSTTHWSFTTGGTTCSCLPSATADKAVFDGSSGGGTVTVDSTINGLTFNSVTMGAFTGTLDFSANNPSLTLNTLSCTGTGTRTLNLGSGTFTLNGAQLNNFDCGTTTNLTLSAASVTLQWNGTGGAYRQLNLPGTAGTVSKIGTITVAADGVGNGVGADCATLNLSAATTLDHLNITAPACVTFSIGGILTLTNAPTWTGTASNPIYLISVNQGSLATISFGGAPTISWASFISIKATTSTGWVAANSFGQGITGFTVSGPSGGGGGGHIIGG